MNLFIVRHGESLAYIDPALNNHPDTALSPLGERQARAVATRLMTLELSRIVSSPLVRALGTAAYIAEAVDHSTIEVWPELCEGWVGAFQSFPRQEILRRFPRANLPDSITDAGWSYPGDESYAAFCARAEAVLRRIETAFSHADRVAVVTHGGLANALLHAILHISSATPRWFELQNASITHVRLVPDPQAERLNWPLIYPPVYAEVQAVNDTAHLRF